MKRVITIILALAMFSTAASAQMRALGIRGGYGAELSGQYSLSGKTFIEGDLGWAFGNINAVGVWDIVFASVSDFNFYIGPGAQLGIYSYTDSNNNRLSGLNLGVVGQIGAEYQIPSVPVNLSLDWRPVFNFFGGMGFSPYYGAFSIRYRF